MVAMVFFAIYSYIDHGDHDFQKTGGGNADQQLRWAASSAAALLLSYVVTLQPAQVDWT